MTLGAFRNDPTQKATYLTRARHAEQLGHIVQGKYWENDAGCAVGVLIHGDDHRALAAALNIPIGIIDLLPVLHDGMTPDVSATFPARFIEAIPVGADLSLIVYRLMHWLLVDPDHGVIRFATSQSRSVVQRIADLHARTFAGENFSCDEWSSAEAAAYKMYRETSGDGEGSAVSVAWETRKWADSAVIGASEVGAKGDTRENIRQERITRTTEQLLTLLASAPTPNASVVESETALAVV